MLRQGIVRAASLVAVLGAVAAATALAQDPGAPPAVVVRLEARAQVPDAVALVGDVARVEGGDLALVRRVADLDVAEVAGGPMAVSREQVALRLRLAGLEPQQFRVEGVARALVSPAPVPLTEAAVVEAVRRALRRALPGQTAETTARLTRPVQVPPLALAAGDVLGLDAALVGTSRVPGRVTAEVAVLVNGVRRAAAPVEVDVQPYQEVAVPRRRIEAGEALTEENLQLERRPADVANGWLPGRQALAGARARRPLPPGQPLRPGDVEAAPQGRPVVIKARDLVKLVARVGPLRVTTVGEALQEGQEGQVIRVRNVDSKNVVQGRVLDQATVEVDY
jgi:flagella basal body P-ring formation protein FlgA